MKSKSQTVAVLMSVYNNDKVSDLILAIESIINQTYDFVDFYIYSDGVDNEHLIKILKNYETYDNIKVFYSENNNGLAYALNHLIEIISVLNYGYIARMDADDISTPERLYHQVSFLNNNSSIDVVGTNCLEIDDAGNVIFEKKMPEHHSDISDFVIKRSPLIHPTVMFRGHIIKRIKYDMRLMNTQDYYLWVDLLAEGLKFHNLQSNLLLFRVSESFFKRRGIGKILNEVSGRIYAMRKLKKFSVKNIIYIIALICIRLSPKTIKKLCYKNLR